MPTRLKNPLSGRRNFRLSPLEMLIVALIVLGVIYLLTLWISGFSAPPGTTATTNSLQAEQAIIATERLGTRLDNLEKTLARLAKTKLKAAATDPKLAGRVDRLEKMVNALAKGKKVVALRSPKQERRLARLERQVSRLEERLAGRMTKAEKELNRLGRLEKELTRLQRQLRGPGSLDSRIKLLEQRPPENLTLGPKVARLQARLDRLEKAQAAKAAAPSPDLEARLTALNQRVTQLSRKLAQQGRRPAPAPGPSPELDKRLAALNQRVAQLSRQVAQLKRAPAAPSSPAASGPAHKKRPAPALVRHKVRRGDTLFRLARRYRVKVAQIRQWNPKLKNRRYLWIGETLLIYPGKTP